MGEDCREVLRDLQQFLDRECTSDLEVTIADHLASCPPCLDRADFERELRRIVALKCHQAAPAGLVDRVIQSLRAYRP